MQAHTQDLQEILSELGTDAERGLDPETARARLAERGPNRLEEARPRSLASRLLDQVRGVLVPLLLLAAVISFALAGAEGGGYGEPVLILLMAALWAALGLILDRRTEAALAAIRDMAPQTARVRRGGREAVVEAAELVPGDILLLRAGDRVPADARLLESAGLFVEQSALTGATVPAEKRHTASVGKNAPLGDRFNMVFAGGAVTRGRGVAVVTATGTDTELGQIADPAPPRRHAAAPLQKRLERTGRLLALGVLAACAVLLLVGLLAGASFRESFTAALALAFSAVPIALPAAVAVILAVGARRMAGQNALVQGLGAVETLGAVSVICADKTGALTQNSMEVKRLYTEGGAAMNFTPGSSPAGESLIKLAALCCDSGVRPTAEGERHVADPAEAAIVRAALRCGVEREELATRYPRRMELPFDPSRRRMTVVCQVGDKLLAITKGALDAVADCCTSGELERGARENEEMGRAALRVLAVGYKVLDELPVRADVAELESGLHFLGLIGLENPVRPEARKAVDACRRAGIRPVMITGDQVVTASAVAKALGILQNTDLAMDGDMLAAIGDGELMERAGQVSVYAGVSPEDRVRIVRALQAKGHVVAVTGDGAGDAPALQEADMGCAMGGSGTDAAKAAADLVLTGDSFAAAVGAVGEGRGIYANLRKAAGYLLGVCVGEALTVLAALILWRETPLVSVQLLLTNMLLCGVPAATLGMEPVEESVMREEPRPRYAGLFAGGVGVRAALTGCLFAALALFAFWLGTDRAGLDGGRTMAIFVLALGQLVQVFSVRGNRSLAKLGPFSNRYLNWAALAALVLLAAVLVIPPLRGAFALAALPAGLYLAGLGLALVPLLVMELVKALGLIR